MVSSLLPFEAPFCDGHVLARHGRISQSLRCSEIPIQHFVVRRASQLLKTTAALIVLVIFFGYSIPNGRVSALIFEPYPHLFQQHTARILVLASRYSRGLMKLMFAAVYPPGQAHDRSCGHVVLWNCRMGAIAQLQ